VTVAYGDLRPVRCLAVGKKKSNVSLNDTELLERARYLFEALDISNITNALF